MITERSKTMTLIDQARASGARQKLAWRPSA